MGSELIQGFPLPAACTRTFTFLYGVALRMDRVQNFA